LNPWHDGAKLRYGNQPSDNPDLWAYMAEYTRTTARIFHGVRLDNCHSTPIHVAQHMLDIARAIRPDLYIFAELFANSERVETTFVKKLGITSVIREAMHPNTPAQLAHLVYQVSGEEPVGSFIQANTRPLCPTRPHGLLFDQTHDNQSIVQTRSVFDALPSSALVCMSCAAVGSVRGYDELVPHHIHVVTETRLYRKWTAQNETQTRGKFRYRNTQWWTLNGFYMIKCSFNIKHGLNRFYLFNLKTKHDVVERRG
jgi:glycogen debranching enzyme